MEYPKWKHLIPETPTIEQFNEAWKLLFEFYPKECVIESIETGINTGFEVRTPTKYWSHGGFGFHTETPMLFDEDIYHRRGITWSTDEFGDRFYYIDRRTQLPVDWEAVVAKEIIRNFLYTAGNKEVLKTLNHLNSK